MGTHTRPGRLVSPILIPWFGLLFMGGRHTHGEVGRVGRQPIQRPSCLGTCHTIKAQGGRHRSLVTVWHGLVHSTTQSSTIRQLGIPGRQAQACWGWARHAQWRCTCRCKQGVNTITNKLGNPVFLVCVQVGVPTGQWGLSMGTGHNLG